MTTRVDLIIVGAGQAGSAAAWVASARRLNVVLLEQFGPEHKNGSSHGSARIFRRAYPDKLHVDLTGMAGERWRQLEDKAGETLLTLTGGVDFGATRKR
jgi:glycine/D-amino acid oxidase-like deaminating enzyme